MLEKKAQGKKSAGKWESELDKNNIKMRRGKGKRSLAVQAAAPASDTQVSHPDQQNNSRQRSPPYLLPKIPVNLFFGPAGPAAALLREAFTADDERSKAAAGPPTLSSKRSHGATSALRGVGPVLPPIARREVGGRGQSMLEPVLGARLGATLGAMLGTMLLGRRAARFALLYCE
jgi:hypothetical protein